MSAKYWKLVITPISAASAATATREVVVEGDNWLSALRAARKALGEDGAVPTGASCVMSATGEVTILDSSKRLRYVLARTDAAAAGAAKPPSVRPPANPPPGTPGLPASGTAPRPPSSGGLPPAPAAVTGAQSGSGTGAVPGAASGASSPAAASAPRRPATMAYSAEESAAIRAQALGLAPAPAEQPSADAAVAPKPGGFAPARPTSRPPTAPADVPRPDPRRPIPPKRAGGDTQGASLPPAAEAPADVRPAASGAAPDPIAPTEPPPPAGPLPGPSHAAQPAQAAAHKIAPPGELPMPPLESTTRAVRPGGRPGRKQTLAYSPEESAAVRAQMGLASAVSTTTSQASSAHDHLVQSEVPSMMVLLGNRDEEPGAESPLTYRERSYFWPPPAQRDEVERALRAELSNLRQTLSGRPRGQYINLAVFDHAFQDKPQRAPVATLQWKDWRGEPAFAWLADQGGAQWQAPAADQPVASSYFPAPTSAAPAASAPPPAFAAPVPPPAFVAPAPPPAFAAPVPPPAFVPSPTPAAALAAPAPAAPSAPPHPFDPAPFGAAAGAFSPPAPAFSPPASPEAKRRLTPIPANQNKPDNTGEQDLRLAVAFEATQDLYFLSTPADGLDFAVRLLSELIPAEAVSGCIYDINTDEFRFVAVTGTGAAERRARAVRGNTGLFAAAARSGLDQLVIPDIMTEPRYEPDIDGRADLLANNMAFFVLHRGGQLFGMLQIINREGPNGFRESDLAVGGYVANQVTSFLREKRGLRA